VVPSDSRSRSRTRSARRRQASRSDGSWWLLIGSLRAIAALVAVLLDRPCPDEPLLPFHRVQQDLGDRLDQLRGNRTVTSGWSIGSGGRRGAIMASSHTFVG